MRIDDRELERLAKKLGAQAEVNLDVDEVARSLVERLRESPDSVVWWRRTPVLSALGAAAVIVVAVGILTDVGGSSEAADTDLGYAPVLLEALSVDELAEVFDTLAFEAPVSELAHAGIEDMSVRQLEELLQTMMEE